MGGDQLSVPRLFPFSADSLQDAAVRPQRGSCRRREHGERNKTPAPGKAQPLGSRTSTALIGIKSCEQQGPRWTAVVRLTVLQTCARGTHIMLALCTAVTLERPFLVA